MSRRALGEVGLWRPAPVALPGFYAYGAATTTVEQPGSTVVETHHTVAGNTFRRTDGTALRMWNTGYVEHRCAPHRTSRPTRVFMRCCLGAWFSTLFFSRTLNYMHTLTVSEQRHM